MEANIYPKDPNVEKESRCPVVLPVLSNTPFRCLHPYCSGTMMSLLPMKPPSRINRKIGLIFIVAEFYDYIKTSTGPAVDSFPTKDSAYADKRYLPMHMMLALIQGDRA